MSNPGLAGVLVLILSACGAIDPSSVIDQQRADGGVVDLHVAVPGRWERACILGPYQDDRAAADTLGFAWPAERRSGIARSDANSLLLFVHGNEVVAAVEHPRGAGDFSRLTGRCFPKARARFVQDMQGADHWPWLVPRDEP